MPRPITFEAVVDVTIDGNQYTVYKLPYNDSYVIFVTDFDKKNDVITKNWHRSSDGYIASTYYENNKKKELYLHNYIAGNLEINGRGQQSSISHINRVHTDNRSINLINIKGNKEKKDRTYNPRYEQAGINVDLIPTGISYAKPSGNFGEYFTLDITLPDGSRYRPKSTKSKHVSLIRKLEESKKTLLEYYGTNPQYFANRNIRYQFSDQDIKLIKEYNQIIESSGLDTKNISKINISVNIDYLAPLDELTIQLIESSKNSVYHVPVKILTEPVIGQPDQMFDDEIIG